MACHFPLRGWRSIKTRGVTFRAAEGYRDRHQQVPCGRCLGCRLDWAGDWAARCEKEAKLWDRNCFITLTYNDENLPLGGGTRSSVSKRDFQLFMMRLREKYGPGIRFFASGEYGAKSERAHYHALLFNHDFADKRLWKRSARNPLFVSAELDKLWPFGFASVGAVTFQSASYVARYVVKKVQGEAAAAAYADREPPFILMSRRPGIGAGWYEKFKGDVYPVGREVVPFEPGTEGTIIVGEGKRRRAPRYFDERFKKENPVGYVFVKARRRRAAGRVGDPTPQQLEARDINVRARVSSLVETL